MNDRGSIFSQKHLAPVLLLILISFAAGYWNVFQKLLVQWSSGDNSYCYLVGPMFIYLCWERKNHFRFDEFSWSLWGIPPALFSIFLFFAGEFGSMETLLYVGLWGSAVSVIVSLYGWRRTVSGLWFPLLILLFIVPLPPFVNRLLTFQMKMAASTISAEMLRAVGITVLQEGNVLDLGVTKLQVVDACSGLRYVASMVLMALLIGHFFATGWWRKVLLIGLVLPLSVFINAGRIFVTGIFSLQGYTFMTEGPLHDSAGIIAFLIAGAILALFANLSMRIGDTAEKDEWVDPGPKRVPGSKSVLAVGCLLALLFAGSGWALQNTGSVMTIPEKPAFKTFPMEIGGWQGKKSDLSDEILDALWADDYVNASFTRPGSPNLIYVLVPYYEYQGTRHTAHAPQSCLLGGGWAISSSGRRQVSVEGRDIDLGVMHLKKDNMQMLASYFFLQRGRVIVSPWWNKFYLMLDAVKMRRTDGALVRVEMFVPDGADLGEAEAGLEQFIRDLWPHLNDYVPS